MLRTRLGVGIGVLFAAFGSVGAGCPVGGESCPACDVEPLPPRPDAGARSFELRILDPSPSLTLVPRAYERSGLWMSEKALAALPVRARTLDVGASLYPTGTVTLLEGDDKTTTRSASIVSFVERPSDRFLVIGSGRAELQIDSGAPVLRGGPDTQVIRLESASAESKCSGYSTPSRAQLSWKAPAHGDAFRTIASQTWDAANACIAVAFDDGEKLSACLPKRAWPFEIGDSVRLPVNGRDERRLEIHGTAAQHDVLALERGKMTAESDSGAVTVQADTLRLSLSPDEGCREVDAACNTSRTPIAYMLTFANGKGTPVSLGGPISDELGVEQRWILGAWIEPVGSSSCAPKEEPPAPRGASVEIVTRIKQPRR